MIKTVKDKSVSAIEGTGQIAKATVNTTEKVVRTAVKDTAKVGGEVGSAAVDAVRTTVTKPVKH